MRLLSGFLALILSAVLPAGAQTSSQPDWMIEAPGYVLSVNIGIGPEGVSPQVEGQFDDGRLLVRETRGLAIVELRTGARTQVNLGMMEAVAAQRHGAGFLVLARAPGDEGKGFSSCLRKTAILGLLDWKYFCGWVYETVLLSLSPDGRVAELFRQYDERDEPASAMMLGDGGFVLLIQREAGLMLERYGASGEKQSSARLAGGGGGVLFAGHGATVLVVLAGWDRADGEAIKNRNLEFVTLSRAGIVMGRVDLGFEAEQASGIRLGWSQLHAVSDTPTLAAAVYRAGGATAEEGPALFFISIDRQNGVARISPVSFHAQNAAAPEDRCQRAVAVVSDGVAIAHCGERTAGKLPPLLIRDLGAEGDWKRIDLGKVCPQMDGHLTDLVLWSAGKGLFQAGIDRYPRPGRSGARCLREFGIDPRLALAAAEQAGLPPLNRSYSRRR